MLRNLLDKITSSGRKIPVVDISNLTIISTVANDPLEFSLPIKAVSTLESITDNITRANTLTDLPIAIRECIYQIAMHRGHHFKHHINAHSSVPCRLPAVCFISRAERQVAMTVYIRKVCFEISYTPLHLQAFLSQVPASIGYASVRRIIVTCMPRPSDTNSKNPNYVSRVHMNLLSMCTGLENLKFIVCLPTFNPLALSLHWLKEFYEVETMLKIKGLRKVTWDMPRSHKKCEMSVGIFQKWLTEEFKNRNGQEVKVVVEWVRA